MFCLGLSGVICSSDISLHVCCDVIQIHVDTHSGDLLKVVGERMSNTGAHMVELGCLTGRARGASVLVPNAEKPSPSLKLRE